MNIRIFSALAISLMVGGCGGEPEPIEVTSSALSVIAVTNLPDDLVPANSVALTSPPLATSANVDALAAQTNNHVKRELYNGSWISPAQDIGSTSAPTIAGVASTAASGATTRWDWISTNGGSSVRHAWRLSNGTSGSDVASALSPTGVAVARESATTLIFFYVTTGPGHLYFQHYLLGFGFRGCESEESCVVGWNLIDTPGVTNFGGKIAAVWSGSRTEIVFTTNTGAMTYMFQSNGSWVFGASPGNTTGALALASWGGGRLDVAYFGSSATLTMKTLTNGAWGGTTTNGSGYEAGFLAAVGHVNAANDKRLEIATRFSGIWQLATLR